MAITPTGAIYKSLNFDGKTSREFGVYITGEAVYNAPEREVEMISIPGRNGAFALDQGRFENIEVTYPAGIFADNEADFAEAISDFRNYLCSRNGYCRLTDEYNPGEYREAIYKSGLEVNPALLRAGEFEIVFECKPQRWLTSGEAKQTIANSGDTLTNPTLFESGPLLEVGGYGTIEFNEATIELFDDLVGDVEVYQAQITSFPYNVTFPQIYISANDEIEFYGASFRVEYKAKNTSYQISSVSISSWSGDASSAPITSFTNYTARAFAYFTQPLKFYYGTASTKTISFTMNVVQAGISSSINVEVSMIYDGDKTVTFSVVANDTSGYKLDLIRAVVGAGTVSGTNNYFTIHSTATTYGHPTYIDCDLGEAYAIDNGVVSSLNQYIDLGSKLPTLAPGSNAITFDNTITSLKITPRWWKI